MSNEPIDPKDLQKATAEGAPDTGSEEELSDAQLAEVAGGTKATPRAPVGAVANIDQGVKVAIDL